MRRAAFAAAALLATTWAAPVWAQPILPQPFPAPPQLAQKGAPGLLLAVPTPTGCNPDGDITREGHLVTLRLVAKVAPNQIHNPETGVADNVSLRSYGGCMTGPLLDVHPGDTLRILLHNGLSVNDPSCPPAPGNSYGCFNTINMHFHGLHVSPAGNSDNVLLNIAPNTDFEYEINIPWDHPSGTFWYHAHRHGSTAIQVASGASGALIVRGDRPYVGGHPGDIDTILHDAAGRPFVEHVFLFQQIPYACFDKSGNIETDKKTGAWVCRPDETGKVEDFSNQLAGSSIWDNSGRFTSINGKVQPPAFGAASGEIQRWRFIHGGIHDTVNLQIVPMVTNAPGAPKAALLAQAAALNGQLSGTPRDQAAVIAKLCPVTVPDGGKPVELVPQFEIATDGITRSKIVPIGVQQQSQPGSIGTNFLQPGYRSDILIAFPHPGTYCVLNEAAPFDERPHNGGGGQGPNVTQLLGTVIVGPGKVVPVDQLPAYVYQVLHDGNVNDPGLPPAALAGLQQGILTPWRGMPEEGPAINSAHPRQVNFYLGNNAQTPPQFGFWVNGQQYDPDRVDKSMTMQVNTTEDWLLTSMQPAGWGTGCCSPEPHIYHIHVNPFEIMDVTYNGKSIYGPNGECLIKADKFGLENQYCNLWHTFKDTIFVQNGYEVHMRTTYDRYIGEYVLHCHILDHEDSGMMENVLIEPDVSQPNGGLGMPGMKTMSDGTMAREMKHP